MTHPTSLRIAGAIGLVFGLMTIFAGGTALFGGAGVQEVVGNAVRFVLWFNFIAGFAYVAAGLGLISDQKWAALLAFGIAMATGAVLIAFALHVLRGGAYEMRTAGALVFRILVWSAIALVTRSQVLRHS